MVIIPALLIALLVIYFIGKNSGKAKALAEDTDTLNNEIDTKTLSYPLTIYKNMADTLYTAMEGLGTDYDTVKSTLIKLNNESDFFQLEKSFGNRAAYTWLYVYTPFAGTLIQWLSDELNEDQKAEITVLLASKNITITI